MVENLGVPYSQLDPQSFSSVPEEAPVMARSVTPKFDSFEVITDEIILIIELGILSWCKPGTAGHIRPSFACG
jgi:hypothetical protein